MNNEIRSALSETPKIAMNLPAFFSYTNAADGVEKEASMGYTMGQILSQGWVGKRLFKFQVEEPKVAA